MGLSADNLTPAQGSTVTFTVTLTNNGPDDSTGVTITNLLPAGFVFVASAATQGSEDGVTGLWTVGGVAAAATQTLTIQAIPQVTGTFTDTAAVTSSDQSDTNPANNTATVTLTVRAANYALTIAKTVSNPSPSLGDIITFTVSLQNQGPASATDVEVEDLLPAGLAFVSASIFAPGGASSYDPATGIWTLHDARGNPYRDVNTLTLTVQVTGCGSVTNTATIVVAANNVGDSASAEIDVTTPECLGTDLGVTKTVINPTPNVGDSVTFTVTLTNHGPNDATGVQVTDLLPSGLTFVAATPAAGTTYDPTTGLWDVGALANGDSVVLVIEATVASPSPQTNTATITHSDQFDPNPGNNTASATVTPQQADLALAKTVSNPTPNVGDSVTFTVTLTNNGPNTATGVQVSDLLPAGLSFTSATPSQGNYNPTTGVWTVGTVTTTSPETLLIEATVASPSPQTNTATITHSDQFDPNPGNNTASATVTPEQADLAVTKTVSNPTPNVGDSVTFTVTLTNNGPNTATGVQVSDLLPAGLSFTSATPSQGTYDPATGLWTVGTVVVGTPQTLVIEATVDSPSPQTNTATISASDQFDPNPGNNTASATVTPQQADLALAKTVSNPTPNVGDSVTFTVTLTNNGPNTATGVQVSDLLPAGLSFTSATPSQGTYDPATGLWTVGTVVVGTPQTLVIEATVDSPSPQTNTATISASDQFDPNPGNNTASATVTPEQADLAVTKTVSNPTPNVGDSVTFTVTLTNNGPNTATGVQVSDLLPAGLSFTSATPSQGTYDPATGLWTVGTVVVGTPQTLVIEATVDSPSPQTNTATISASDQFDPNPGNNTASATVTPQQADLAVTKTVSNPTPNVGDSVTFTVTLTNNGPNTATGVQVSDLLPAGLSFTSATPSQGNYNPTTGVWTVGTVTTTSPETLLIEATVASPSPQTNTATITHSDQFDPNPGNNTASATVTPEQADLAVTKTVSNPTPNVGDSVTFTVTLTNNGPNTATGVQVSDLLPAGLSFTSASRPAAGRAQLYLGHPQSGHVRPRDRAVDGGHGRRGNAPDARHRGHRRLAFTADEHRDDQRLRPVRPQPRQQHSVGHGDAGAGGPGGD